MSDPLAAAESRPDLAAWAGLALGFGMGGFFDGILLHQVLQWHHLLSGVESVRQDLRLLILADGLFHAAMYVVTGVGLWLLWRSRQRSSRRDRSLTGLWLIGFGSWHVLDAVLSHWLLGIHRIRMDVDDPLPWDISWVVVFGLVPLVAGWLQRSGRGRAGGVMSSPLALGLAALLSGGWAALPPAEGAEVMVLFGADVSEPQALAAVLAAGGSVSGTDPSGQLWMVALPPGSDLSELHAGGALVISRSLIPLGCLQWTRA